MRYYETLLLLTPQATSEMFDSVKAEFTKVVAKHGGTVDRFDIWGKYHLAYPVRKHDYGFYVLVRHKTEELALSLCKDLDSLLFIKFNEPVMRHTHVKLSDSDYSAEYSKPEPMTSGAPAAQAAPRVEPVTEPKKSATEEVASPSVEAASNEEVA